MKKTLIIFMTSIMLCLSMTATSFAKTESSIDKAGKDAIDSIFSDVSIVADQYGEDITINFKRDYSSYYDQKNYDYIADIIENQKLTIFTLPTNENALSTRGIPIYASNWWDMIIIFNSHTTKIRVLASIKYDPQGYVLLEYSPHQTVSFLEKGLATSCGIDYAYSTVKVTTSGVTYLERPYIKFYDGQYRYAGLKMQLTVKKTASAQPKVVNLGKW